MLLLDQQCATNCVTATASCVSSFREFSNSRIILKGVRTEMNLTFAFNYVICVSRGGCYFCQPQDQAKTQAWSVGNIIQLEIIQFNSVFSHTLGLAAMFGLANRSTLICRAK